MYQGQFSDGKKSGKGRYFFKNGDFYNGQFLNNDCHGQGIFYYNKSKETFIGYWKHGKAQFDQYYILNSQGF